MAKSKIDKDDIKRLVENTSNPSSTSSVYSAKYVEDNFAQLEDGKIKATNLPDYLLGQVLYGGSINSSRVCTLSSLYKDKFNTTDTTRLLANLTASSYVGVYFIASGNFLLNGTIDVNVGDWVISDGITWGKIDNTDAVASVNGQTGVVNLDYGDLGEMPEATDTEVGGIKIGYIQGLDADLLDGKHASDFATSAQGAKADTALQAITKAMVEAVLTGVITSHQHNYTTSTDVQTLINTAVASVYKPKGNIADKTALLALTNVKQGDVYNAQNPFTLDNGQNVKAGDNIVCLSDAATSEDANWDNLSGNQVNRTIKVNGVDKAGSATTIPLNFIGTDGISVYGNVNQGILDITFSSNTLPLMGALDGNVSFQSGGLSSGIYDILSENTYSYVPNVDCGTDASKSGMKGTLIVQLNGVGKSLIYHCFNTNNIYICSGTIHETEGSIIWATWKRLLTCKDEKEVIIGKEGKYSYTINRGGTEIYVDSSYDPKSDSIEIDISSFKDIIPTYIGFNIIFSTPITAPLTVNIYNGTTKTINTTQFYQDPINYTGTISEIQYRIWNRVSDWLYHNRIL